MGCPRILLADDHHEMLRKITELLESEFEIVAAVCKRAAAYRSSPPLEPPSALCSTSRCRSSME